jgi:7,8-dihydropterin-6-yl-methyl-4-(beta-D-ribofuranosyl)aminobenzene 5'-phosphate synthase
MKRKALPIKQALAVSGIWLMMAQFAFDFSAAAQIKPGSLGVTLTNVYDAFGEDIQVVTQSFGFSTVINYKGKWILFDSGTDARIFEKNLKALKIDLRKIDIAIVSHGHYDHIGGFDYLLKVNPKVKIYAPNDFFSLGSPTKLPFRETEPETAQTLPKDERYFRGEKVLEGMTSVPTGKFWKADVEYLTEAKEVLPGVTIVPTTSELMGTFTKYPPFEKNPQFIGLPELSLSLATEKGDIVISGCSHSSIERIVDATQKVRKNKIYLLTGGFHLIPYKRDYIEALARRLKDYEVESVAPAHCTGHLGFSIFRQEFGNKYRFFGLGETLEF